MSKLLKDIQTKISRLVELESDLQNPEITSDPRRMRDIGKEVRELQRIRDFFNEFKKIEGQLKGAKEMLGEEDADSELRKMAELESESLSQKLKKTWHELEELLIKKDPLLSKNAIVEVRAGTGGVEASLFAAQVFRMYAKYAVSKGSKVEILSQSITEAGGIREIIFSVNGNSAYGHFKFESGVHRVQRVPTTETSGRIHTSAVTVAVLPEAEDVEVQIKPEEIRVDVFRSGGPGGQSVNTTDSAVRVTHVPTGLVVKCQDEKSQLKNKNKAMKILRARLFDEMQRRSQQKIAKERKAQVGSGDRSEKIRTYNFPDRRVTDHRIGLTLHTLERVLEGALDDIVDALYKKEKE